MEIGKSDRWAKSGLVAGIPYGIILAIGTYFTTLSMKQTIIQAITQDLPSSSPYTPDQLFSITLLVEPVIVIAVGVVGGLILGAIYGWAFRRIPGGTALVKGVIFGILLWVLFSVLGGLDNSQYGIGYYSTQVAIGLVASLLFGWLLGYFYGRFTRPKELLTGPT
jgi:hypothetical protein